MHNHHLLLLLQNNTYNTYQTRLDGFNKGLAALNVAPILVGDMRSEIFKENKIREITKAINAVIFESTNESETFESEMIAAFKAKMEQCSDINEKYRILTSLPQSWGPHKIAREFGVKLRMARRSKELVLEKGPMSTPKDRIPSRTTPDSVVKLVHNFYSDDECSRACAGSREYTIVNEDGEKITKQRRMLMMNLNEAYQLFKKEHPSIKIGFSKFASLRPKEVRLTIENGGIHSTCVCMYHQNMNLIFEPLKRHNIFGEDIKHYKDLIDLVLCKEATENCHLLRCNHCPKFDLLKTRLQTNLQKANIDVIDIRQWSLVSG